MGWTSAFSVSCFARYSRIAVFLPVVLAAGVESANAQTEHDRTIAFGLEIYKIKGNCQFCHKWDGTGDQGYGGNALSFRKTALTREQLEEVVKCGRPSTGMPLHDKFAYTDKRCYGLVKEDLGKDIPPQPFAYLNKREIEAVAEFLFARVVGKPPATYEDCVEFWGSSTRQCDPLKP